MEKYIAFLRGINISGKNKIAMKELKEEFVSLGFYDVKTYLNSGNVLYSADRDDRKIIEDMIKEKFFLDIPVYTISFQRLKEILDMSPIWWNDKNTYNNLIFILDSEGPSKIKNLIGVPSKGLEKVQIIDEVIFWSFNKNNYQKCHWWKMTSTKGISEKLTIRTANTLYKIVS